jgi:chloramphenicol 3-O-phosphotransferase
LTITRLRPPSALDAGMLRGCMSSLILITGIMAAGKSTVAQRVAERLAPRSVHLRGDVFRRMIVNGRAEMGRDLSEEARAQLALRYQLAVLAAGRYLDAGFDVIHQDIVIGPALSEVVAAYLGRPLHVVVLCPAAESVAAREAGRTKVGYRGIDVVDLDRALREDTPRIGLWVDSSAQTAAETADHILANLSSARV